MTKLKLIKSAKFGETQADIYSNSKDVFMTINQLAACLGYADRSGVQKLIARNPYLNHEDFSGWDVLSLPQGGSQKTRIFTEDGIYEITMLSGQPKAKEFRAWVRKVLKALRTGKATLIDTNRLDEIKIYAQQDRAKAMLLNAQNRALKTLMTTIQDKKLSPIAVEVFGLRSIEQVTGIDMGQHLPQYERTYSATEVGEMLHVSSQKIGKLANAHGLKTDTYGVFVMDKSKYSAKEVSSFRYNRCGVERIKALL